MDLLILETGNGGDTTLNGNDLSMVFSFENMPYLAMFGGNKEAVTKPRLASEQAFDFWGNTLLMPNDASIQFNSLTEKALDTYPLTSSGRLLIEDAIKKDLQFMAPFAEVTVNTQIIATDTLQINIGITKPDNLQERQFIYIWEAGRLTVVNQEYTENTSTIPDDMYFEMALQFYL